MINFPGLNIKLSIEKAITLFGYEIYWYGIIIGIAVLIGIILAYKNCKKYDIKSELLDDYLIWVIPLSIIGARIFYVLFELNYYITNPEKILNLRDGGLAIYGAIITATIITLIFCKIKKITFSKFADFLVPYLALGQAIGRWGNFVNQEAYGIKTNLPWRMEIWSDFYQEIACVHPTFLYESIWNLILFFILIKMRKNSQNKQGTILTTYLIGYGIGRFWIEGLRTDSLMINSYKISQLISLILVIICIIKIIYEKNYIKCKNKVGKY